MKLSTLNNRIAKENKRREKCFLPKISKSSVAYKTLMSMLNGDTSKMFINISNRNTAKDYCADVKVLANQLGIRVRKGHDYKVAPKGGLLGDFVQLMSSRQTLDKN